MSQVVITIKVSADCSKQELKKLLNSTVFHDLDEELFNDVISYADDKGVNDSDGFPILPKIKISIK